ncbi:hypothetical protein MRX96_020011 [Rhipicephalus microplus]
MDPSVPSFRGCRSSYTLTVLSTTIVSTAKHGVKPSKLPELREKIQLKATSDEQLASLCLPTLCMQLLSSGDLVDCWYGF